MKLVLPFIFVTIAGGLVYASSDRLNVANSLQTNALPQDTTINADSIVITGYDDLDELVVTAAKKVLTSDGATLTYNMEEDVSAKGQSLLDAIKKIPLISIDGEDNIKVNGESNFKVYVNGREDPSLTANASQVFKAMPADAVVKVEVITEPGAKYDAEGVGGILNLVTEKKQSKDGYSANINIYGGNLMSGGSLYGRVKYHNITADANVSYTNGEYNKRESRQLSETVFTDNGLEARKSEMYSQRMGFHFLNGNANISWEPSAKDIITGSFSIMTLGGKISDSDGYSRSYGRDGNLISKYDVSLSGRLKQYSTQTGASYQHNFSDEGHHIVAGYLYSHGKSPLTTRTVTSGATGLSFPDSISVSEMNNYTNEHTFQLDYSLPIDNARHIIETGAKLIMRDNPSQSYYYYGNSDLSLTESLTDRSDFIQRQSIAAGYASYKGVFGKLTASAGLRYEFTRMGIDFKSGDRENFRNNLNDWVPNASLTYSFDMLTNLRVSYQMRITRPSVENVNPYEWKITPNNIRLGNPDLTSERNNNIKLTFTKFWTKCGGNVGLEYSITNNAIGTYNYWKDNIFYSKSDNNGRASRSSLNLMFNYNITRALSATLSGKLSYLYLKNNDLKISNHGFTGDYNLNVNYNAPHSITISGYGGQSLKSVVLQGSNEGWYYYGLGLSKGFLTDNAFRISLNAGSFLTKYHYWRNTVVTSNSISKNEYRSSQWQVSLSLSYNFGQLHERVKKTSIQINNDDLSKNNNNSLNTGGGSGQSN